MRGRRLRAATRARELQRQPLLRQLVHLQPPPLALMLLTVCL